MITILSGAGASYAVNNEKFPTTVQYLAQLGVEIRKNPYFKQMDDLLRQSNTDTLDIENYLWGLTKTIEVFSTLVNPKHRNGKIFQYALGEFHSKLQSARQHASLRIGLQETSMTHIQNAINGMTSLCNKIHENVFSFYASDADESELENNWLYLIKKLASIESQLSFFTLNYDWIPEKIQSNLEQAERFFTGRRTDTGAVLDTSFWEKKQYENEDAPDKVITKLHGSVDWRNDNGKIYVGNPNSSGT